MRQGRYTTGRILEKSSRVTVYLGYDQVLDQKTVIREYPLEIWRGEKERESALLFKNLDLPGMAAVRDYFEEDGKGYAVSICPEGETLETYLDRGKKFGEEEALRLLLPAAEALEALHALGLVCGNLAPGHLVLGEGGYLILTADCRGYLEEGSGWGAPEQYDPEGILGPWTDVYGLCALWYEMVTGQRVPAPFRRKIRDSLKAPSHYLPVDKKTEEALLQGLSLSVQTRYFSLGTLWESLGAQGPKSEKTAGAIRHRWGEKWLSAAEQTETDGRKGRGRGYLKKRLLTAGLILGGVAALAAGGLRLYVQTHQPQYFIWKAGQARKSAGSLETAQFYLDPETVRKALEFYLPEEVTDWDEESGGEVLTQLVCESSADSCAVFLEKILPLLAPETYLTGEEARELLAAVSKEGESKILYPSANYEIFLSHPEDGQEGDSGTYRVEIRPLGTVFTVEGEPGETYAGNYDRGSEAYEKFADFVRERAVGQETAGQEEDLLDLSGEGAVLYTLTEEDVREWGEPCNRFRFFTGEEDLIAELKDQGYAMEQLSENPGNTVEFQRYGGIKTNFHVVRRYRMTEELGLAVSSDSVNGDILELAVYCEKDSGAPLAETAAEIASLAGSIRGQELEDLPAGLENFISNPDPDLDVRLYTSGNVVFHSDDLGENGTALYMMPVQTCDFAPYYWPL